jgi:hypothetical protein
MREGGRPRAFSSKLLWALQKVREIKFIWFLKEIFLETKKNIADDMFVLTKLNTRDYTPREGITLEMSKKYAEWLAELAIDGLELSCGTLTYSMFNRMRGEVLIKVLITHFPWWRKVLGKMMLKKLEGKFDLEEGYNLRGGKAH